ncbi:hypothetical protein [Azospirillum halopraeferens]|uniref:hypothetical protein n=1 Tax=Azospirillum halopraeferens TaxID=34010 RepID=UPI0003FE5F0F|nr:hypothetical protein [Azospirillum halopraeferens]
MTTGPLRFPGRSAVLRLLLAAAAALLVLSLVMVLRDVRDNRLIGGLAAGRDLAVGDTAVPEVRFARAHFLMQRDRLDEARAEVERISAADAAAVRAAALYDLANAGLRAALEHLEAGRIDPATALIRIAKDDYRRALALDPGFWDAKHNLDVAMRLVRDFPEVGSGEDEQRPDTAKPLWTDLPGLPRGLP